MENYKDFEIILDRISEKYKWIYPKKKVRIILMVYLQCTNQEIKKVQKVCMPSFGTVFPRSKFKNYYLNKTNAAKQKADKDKNSSRLRKAKKWLYRFADEFWPKE